MGRDLREDQEYIFDEIAEYAGRYEPDAIVIAGDIYDKSIPSAEAVDLFDRFVQSLTAAAPSAELMMISGNHDSDPYDRHAARKCGGDHRKGDAHR